jgi:hypothetical protein
MDVITVTSVVTAGNHAISLLRSVAETLKSSGKADAINQLIEAQLAMMDLLEKHQALQGESDELKRRILELETLIALIPTVQFHFEAYWCVRGNGSLDGPFSTQVWDLDRKLVRMHFVDRVVFDDNLWIRFRCLKVPQYCAIPAEFLKTHNVWSREELGNRRPSASPGTPLIPEV